MPTPRFNYTPRWVLDSMKKPDPPVSSIRQPAPPLRADPVEMQNHPDPMIGQRLKWLKMERAEDEEEMVGQALGSSIRNFGISLLSNMGPRPQGTGSLWGDLGDAIAVGAASYQDAKDRARADMQEGRMMEALQDPKLLAPLTESQRRLVGALPPAAGLQMLAGMVGPQELQKVENPAEGTLDWYDPLGNLVKRTSLPQAPQRQLVQSADGTSAGIVDLTTGEVEGEINLGEKEPEYTYQQDGNRINVLSDGDLVRSIMLPAQGLQRGSAEYGQQLLSMNKDFRSLRPVKVWDETQVQIESAQKAYQNNEVYNNPQAQLQMVIAFAKILDPESVVREGEIHIQTSAASLADKINIAYKQAKEGAVVSQQMMDNLLLGIEEVGKSRYDNFIREAATMAPIYQKNQIGRDDIGLIMGDLTEPQWVMRERTRTPVGMMDFGDIQPPAADAMPTGQYFNWR